MSRELKFGWLSPVIGNRWSDYEPIAQYQDQHRREDAPGINHARKGTFHFTVTGKDALFDDVRVWSASPAKAK